MSCPIDKFVMTDRQIKAWCKEGCSVDCYLLLSEKYKLRDTLKVI